MKGDLPCDPRGLIAEAYRIEGISAPECRAIFLDWALGVPAGESTHTHSAALLAHYRPAHPDHPMTEILQQALADVPNPRRRGRRRQ